MGGFGFGMGGQRSAAPAGGGGGGAAWVADAFGGTAADQGGGSYLVDAGTDYQGAFCGPLTGDFVCAIDPSVGTNYSLEVGVAVGATFTNPSFHPYDGRVCFALFLVNPTGNVEQVIDNKNGGNPPHNSTEAAPNDHTYTIERTGSSVVFKKDGSILTTQTVAGTVFLYSSHTSAADSGSVVRTTV